MFYPQSMQNIVCRVCCHEVEYDMYYQGSNEAANSYVLALFKEKKCDKMCEEFRVFFVSYS